MINLRTKFKVPVCSRYEAMNGGANVQIGVAWGS